MTRFHDLLATRGVLLADGATGTNFQDMGIEPGVAPEEWVTDAPERVLDLHRRFVDAGSDLLLTCSFGASPIRLLDSPLAGRADEINTRAAELAREAAGDGVLVAGSVGPTGQLPEPYGLLSRDAAVQAFSVQATALARGGADLLVLETFFALDEALWAAEGIRSVTDLPLVIAFSFDQGTRTMMGLSAADVVAATAELELAAVGANCGRSLEDNAAVVQEFLAAGVALPLWVKPNAGVPYVTGEGVIYPEDPESFAPKVAALATAGAQIVGGCCGSTPAHLAALRAALA
ncbi:MAG TPA: homocysteine S-methyltransferase family protein [Solirubrobacteraceae bacterium]|nr:homocysteine S-methyltransferase family protein [Solirubrobacteraceae bacterium]